MLTKVRDFLELIKFEHTVFALPFAYIGMLLAARGWPGTHAFFWITVAMASARTLAMGVNRIVDRRLDAHNPRTASRPLVTGRISLTTALVGTVIAGMSLLLAAWQLGPLPLRLLPGALVFLVGYSFTKRFTWLSHFILGFTDGLAPMGAWVAVRASLFRSTDLPAWLLLGAVACWIAGFDILYACQDVEFDREAALHAVPARFGVRAALRLSAACHGLALVFLLALGLATRLHSVYWIGWLVAGALLAYEHTLVRPEDLSRLNVAFFTLNGYVSLSLMITVWAAIALFGPN